MKKRTISILCALCVLATTATAQIELGLNAGLDKSGFGRSFYYSPVASLKLGYNINKKWQVGISANLTNLTYDFIMYPGYIISPHFIAPMEAYPSVQTTSAFSYKAYISRQFHYKSITTYGGMSAGYIVPNATEFVMDYYLPGAGFVAGINAGGIWYCSRRVGINADIEANYNNIRRPAQNMDNLKKDRMGTWAFPATIGIRYRLR